MFHCVCVGTSAEGKVVFVGGLCAPTDVSPYRLDVHPLWWPCVQQCQTPHRLTAHVAHGVPPEQSLQPPTGPHGTDQECCAYAQTTPSCCLSAPSALPPPPCPCPLPQAGQILLQMQGRKDQGSQMSLRLLRPSIHVIPDAFFAAEDFFFSPEAMAAAGSSAPVTEPAEAHPKPHTSSKLQVHVRTPRSSRGVNKA